MRAVGTQQLKEGRSSGGALKRKGSIVIRSRPVVLIDLDQRRKDSERMVKPNRGGFMKQIRTMQAVLAAVALACGTLGSIELTGVPDHSQQLLRGDFTILVSSAAASESRGLGRRASCALVRYYVARYTAATAEAWARSKGATDAEIQIARGCIKPQQTALIGHIAD